MKTSTLKAMAQMDLEKLNFDLIVQLLEWLVLGKHKVCNIGLITKAVHVRS